MGSARVDRRVFLSHSSKDKGDIQRLAKALGERGIGVWGGVLELRLGQLCFENADDAAQGKLERRTERVDAAELGELLRERRVALFVLEACQTAMTAANPTASVAAALLASGVASVVAMSHAVYVETGRRFVAAFYGALASGDRIGAAMVRAQHALEDDRARCGRSGRAGAFGLEGAGPLPGARGRAAVPARRGCALGFGRRSSRGSEARPTEPRCRLFPAALSLFPHDCAALPARPMSGLETAPVSAQAPGLPFETISTSDQEQAPDSPPFRSRIEAHISLVRPVRFSIEPLLLPSPSPRFDTRGTRPDSAPAEEAHLTWQRPVSASHAG